jgi:hypothetical protein
LLQITSANIFSILRKYQMPLMDWKLKNGIGLTTAIPATQHFHGSRFRLHPIKYLEVFLYDISPDFWALTNFRMTLGKETEAFPALNDHVAPSGA